jgi:hypothetical protein
MRTVNSTWITQDTTEIGSISDCPSAEKWQLFLSAATSIVAVANIAATTFDEL